MTSVGSGCGTDNVSPNTERQDELVNVEFFLSKRVWDNTCVGRILTRSFLSKPKSKRDSDVRSHVCSHLSPDSPRVWRLMSLYYTPNVYRPHPSNDDSDPNPPRDVQSNLRPQRRPSTTRGDRLRQRQRETSLNDSTDTGSIFIFPQPPNSTSPIPSNPHSSPRSPYSEDSVISRPAHRRSDTTTSRSSPISQSESITDVDGISTPTTIVTLSIGSSPISAFTDVGEDEASLDDGRIEAMLWDWDDSTDEGVDGPVGELWRSPRSMRPGDMPQASFVRRSQVRPWPLQHGSGERLRALIEHEQFRNRWRDASRFQNIQQSRSRSYSPLSTPSNREIDLLSFAPLPKIKIPFLDFFASLLGVEESTMDLLTRCSTIETHGSVLFPGATIQPLPAPTTIVDEEDYLSSTTAPADRKANEDIHGFHRALLSPGIERDSWASLKEGLSVFYNTAASVPTQNPGRLLGLAQLWGLVSHVYVRGGKVIKSVYSPAPASSSRIEEVKRK